MTDGDDEGGTGRKTAAYDLVRMARGAEPREVTSATFSYVDGLLAGRMSETEFASIRAEILGESAREPPCEHPDAAELARIHASMAERDYAGALAAAEALLERHPEDRGVAATANECRGLLADVYQAQLGNPEDAPRLAVALDDLGAHGLDRWAAFLLSRMEGVSSIADLIDATGFTRLDTLRLLYELVQRGIVRMEHAPPPSGSGGGVAVARVRLKRSR